ncbi:DUF350 domain-containing protein [Lujinxingia vulgaris]|uniref:DUF350 domain-containing protein n=1 Tax=Lujinxingia vulgaris TaxID=2600176 RepID=A0A5C6X2Q4_9DELT|nr:DUF350 domain-containing protein [Lujinxingia vulgaris]TXD33774.1 DUF350 domain-containing protein [Lujinxingia vulgaris]
MDMAQLGQLITQILGWSLGGMAALVLARYAYKVIAPFDVNAELVGDRNTAVGASKGMFQIAAAIILHGLVGGDRMASTLWADIALVAGLFLLGLLMLWVGRVILVAATSFDFNKQIHEEDNLAVGLIEGSYFIAFAVIIHGVI